MESNTNSLQEAQQQPNLQVGGSSSSSAPHPEESQQQDIFGVKNENFDCTQLNPGESYAPIHTQDSAAVYPSAPDIVLPGDTQYDAGSQYFDQSLAQSQAPGAAVEQQDGAGGAVGQAEDQSLSNQHAGLQQPTTEGLLQQAPQADSLDPLGHLGGGVSSVVEGVHLVDAPPGSSEDDEEAGQEQYAPPAASDEDDDAIFGAAADSAAIFGGAAASNADLLFGAMGSASGQQQPGGHGLASANNSANAGHDTYRDLQEQGGLSELDFLEGGGDTFASVGGGVKAEELDADAAAKAADDDELDQLFGSDNADAAPAEAAPAEEAPPEDEFDELFAEDLDIDMTQGLLPPEEAHLQLPPTTGARIDEDEEDLFGAISEDDADVTAEAISLARAEFENKREVKENCLFKIPNVISWEAKAFDPSAPITQPLAHMWAEKEDVSGRTVIKLKNPENTFRWRFKKDEEGKKILDANEFPVYESNGKFVEFENGDKFLVIGKEYFPIMESEHKVGREHLFSEISPNVFAHHKPIFKTATCIPNSISSTTHEMLMKAQIKKVQPNASIKQVTAKQVAERQQRYELDQEAERKQRKAVKDMQSQKRKQQVLTADFLEDDNYGVSLKKVKNEGRGKNMDSGFLNRAAGFLGQGPDGGQ
ncbi:unnamed protein product [Amoebophrya sp. A25]|nr:unnamed protein product [Amoebophrya sp. A25]|eukprot:GSA25T00010302001.1